MKITDLKIKLKIFDQFKILFCNWLNNYARKWPNKKVKMAVVAFAIISSGISLYAASKALFGGSDFVFPKRSPGATPILPHAYPGYHLERSILLYNKIEQTKKWLDSLSLHDTSRYQAILKANPKVVENIQSIESLFSELIKK